MNDESKWTDEELSDLYKHRNDSGFYFKISYSSLNQTDKDQYEIISAKKTVEKWRGEGSLINRIINFSKEDNEKYSEFIELEEKLSAYLQRCLAESILSLKQGKKTNQEIKNEICRMKPEQMDEARDFLKNELSNPSRKNTYGSEINFIISCLQ